ncbi:MAG TPA: proprotein convertase P-domain-containing protein [Tahibacter sp.]|uniref:proprotein convertase P-domain-containing protein n=1 Tax=Tahibacter sp. TaxID=2056211 RepID=UPI002BE5270E|nr:proprotein convertase P-domain-containing protein [Tahibacter sp.]HSX58703.1 proprotein convertase P-domain-containing protein [Tahibacter sp.]
MRSTAVLALLGFGLLASSSVSADSFNGTNTGAIPDAPAGSPSCGVNNLGQPRVVSFDVNGLLVPVVAVSVSMNLNHTWRGDLVVKLAAPGGTPSKIVFSHTGSNVPGGCGHNGILNGLYTFEDTSTAGDWWGAAFSTVPPGSYHASTPGGQNPGGEEVQLSTEFRNLAPELANGTWTLTFWDAGDPTPGQPGSGTGSVNAATLIIDQTDQIFEDDFEPAT